MTIWLTIETFRQMCFDVASAAIWTQEEAIPNFDTRFTGRLESCLEMPRLSFEGEMLYPTLEDQAAFFFYLLIKNHPFLNGNKRIAVTALFVVLFLNGKWLSIEQNSLYQLTVRVASSEAKAKDAIIAEITKLIRYHLINLGSTMPTLER
jgi:death-on-curing family protein